MAEEMETFAARLASFDLVLQPEKRRSSSAKAVKPIAWPYHSPSPAELAHAGFYYNPYETNPDNTTCFQCRRALDGWEEDDNPITEHLKHSPDCGWAIMMDIQQHSSNPAEIEDPTSEKIREARLATFGASWPHDGKRGWMVDGGWYFCPTEESNDLASCAYCKLSLDGWEPKDDPFTASQPGTKSKSTKKSSKAKSKSSKAKKEEVAETDSQMDIDTADYSQLEPSKTKRTTRGKKRTSDQIESEQVNVIDTESVEEAEPPAKKRATKSRNSTQEYSNQNEEVIADMRPDESMHEEEPKRGRGTTKKKASSKSQKASTGSSTSKTTSKPRAPSDHELYAALVADLEKAEPGELTVETTIKPSKKSKAKTRKTTPEPTAPSEPLEEVIDNANEIERQTDRVVPEEPVSQVTAQEVKPSPAKSTRRSRSSIIPELESEPSTETLPKTSKRSESNAIHNDESDSIRHQSFVSVEIPARGPEKESKTELIDEGESNNKGPKKKNKQRSSTEKAKKSKKPSKTTEPPEPKQGPVEQGTEARKSPLEQPPIIAGPDTAEQKKPEQSQEQEVEQPSTRRRSSRVPPKTAERYSDIPEEKQFARSFAGSQSSNSQRICDSAEQENVSPLPASKSTLSLSPQSSDAENQPPLLKPSVSRPPITSPSKQQAIRVPLATSTPSPSKRNANTGSLYTTRPWNPIDIDEILLTGTGDKENFDFNSALNNVKGELTSPEKKMTVEEWIKWNAKNGEEKLRHECEKLVGQFEQEGARAMRVLEGIECID
ncbi:hypothetical protein BBP40_005546 [Aspergillus hancockii]|nr:hypothetical protein BBP40_005546 [Aspergillus hancockii]